MEIQTNYSKKIENLVKLREELNYHVSHSFTFSLCMDSQLADNFARFSVLFSYAIRGFDVKAVDKVLYSNKYSDNEKLTKIDELEKTERSDLNIDSIIFLRDYLKKDFVLKLWNRFDNLISETKREKRSKTKFCFDNKQEDVSLDSFFTILDDLLSEFEHIIEFEKCKNKDLKTNDYII